MKIKVLPFFFLFLQLCTIKPKIEQQKEVTEVMIENSFSIKSAGYIHCISGQNNEYSVSIQLKNLRKDTILLRSTYTDSIFMPHYYTLKSIGGQVKTIKNGFISISRAICLLPLDSIDFEVPFVSNYANISKLDFDLGFRYDLHLKNAGFEKHTLSFFYGFCHLPKCNQTFLLNHGRKGVIPYRFPYEYYGFGI
jgi:hypothetical protein